jgi:hypothetical protein
MASSYWFGASFAFTCPNCKRLSSEKLLIDSPTDDQGAISQRLTRETLTCQLCQATLLAGVDVQVEVLPGSIEYLKSQGFR